MDLSKLDTAVQAFLTAVNAYQTAESEREAAAAALDNAIVVSNQKEGEAIQADADAEAALMALLTEADAVGITLPQVVPVDPVPEPEG